MDRNLVSPNYASKPELHITRLGKLVRAAGIAALAAATGVGATAVFEHAVHPHNNLVCEPSDATVSIGPGETVWEDVARPLATEYQIPVDTAMQQISVVNPGIANFGNVSAWEQVVIPVCTTK